MYVIVMSFSRSIYFSPVTILIGSLSPYQLQLHLLSHSLSHFTSLFLTLRKLPYGFYTTTIAPFSSSCTKNPKEKGTKMV